MPRRSVLAVAAVGAALCLTPAPPLSAIGGGAPVVDAEVLGVSVVPRANGQRVAFTELLTDEVIRVEVRIIRYQTVVARKTVRRLGPGRWAITLSLPAALARGRARAQVRLEDLAGTVAWYRQPVRVPAVGP